MKKRCATCNLLYDTSRALPPCGSGSDGPTDAAARRLARCVLSVEAPAPAARKPQPAAPTPAGSVQCFLIRRTGRVVRQLRRFVFSAAATPACPNGYHDASSLLDVVDAFGDSGDLWAHDDPRWPTACACGYAFLDTDRWQLSHAEEFERPDTGERQALEAWPAGAMWWRGGPDDDPNGYFRRLSSPKHQARGDGAHLFVRTPGGDWNIDQKSANGSGWDRTGDAPNVTASPSILIHGTNGRERYHGWLRHGVLIPC